MYYLIICSEVCIVYYIVWKYTIIHKMCAWWLCPQNAQISPFQHYGPEYAQICLKSLLFNICSPCQLAARGTKERARLGWPFLSGIFFILKSMMFHEVTTVLNKRKHLKMVIRSIPDAVSLILGRTQWLGFTALHRVLQVDLMRHRTQFQYSCQYLVLTMNTTFYIYI
jgi:hypothetical protein